MLHPSARFSLVLSLISLLSSCSGDGRNSSAASGGDSTSAGGAEYSAGGSSASFGGVGAGAGTPAGGSATGLDASGGASAAAGGSVAAGAAPAGGAGAGAEARCAPDCGTHKWACWPMPNPTGAGLPSEAEYAVSSGVVHDNFTCLDWEQTPSSSTFSNSAAIEYCENLSLGGYTDWRIPTRVEMMSIMDWTRSPAIDAAFGSAGGFHKTGSNWILTINQSGAGAGTDYAWAFNMSDGIVSNARSAATSDTVRCVRGNGSGEGFSEPALQPSGHYTILSDADVLDRYTGLIWQRDGDATPLVTWEEARDYCASISLGGAEDWRLPSVRELSTLVDETRVAPAIDTSIFTNTHYGARSENWYWASHLAKNGSSYWGINFDDGFTGFNAGASGSWNYWTRAYTKCVR